MRRSHGRIGCLLWTGAISLHGAGCGPDLLYLPSLAAGQLDVILGSVPIDVALEQGRLSDEFAAKLVLVLDVREFAENEMGLTVGDDYTLYYDNENAARVFNVSASDKHRFRAMTWTFPIVGVLPYLGFFDGDLAMRELEQLQQQGFDTFAYEVDAYSTLSYLPNPVRATFLNRDDISIVETVIHELLHATVWRPGDVSFNESLATFVGRTGALEFYARTQPAEAEILQDATARFADVDRYNAFILELFNELDAFYSSNLDRETKIAGRNGVFQAGRDRFFTDIQPTMDQPERYDWIENLPTNNAWMLANYRYNLDLDVFERAFIAAGKDWRAAIALFRDSAVATDPRAFPIDQVDDGRAHVARSDCLDHGFAESIAARLYCRYSLSGTEPLHEDLAAR